MFDKIGLLTISFFLLLIAPLSADSADSVVFDGEIRISNLGNLVFPDGSMQDSATVQGPKGETGTTGLQGPPGPTDPSYSALNYYALGDSITLGAVTTSGRVSYADILHAKCNFNSITKLAADGTAAMPYTGGSELSTQVNAIGADADIITIMIGVIDCNVRNILGDVDSVLQIPYVNLDKSLSFAEAFRYCLETIKRNHELARIYLILPLQTSRPRLVSMEQYRTVEIKIANYLSIPVIYAHTESGLWAGGTFMPDEVHPTEMGHSILGNYIARKIIGL